MANFLGWTPSEQEIQKFSKPVLSTYCVPGPEHKRIIQGSERDQAIVTR